MPLSVSRAPRLYPTGSGGRGARRGENISEESSFFRGHTVHDGGPAAFRCKDRVSGKDVIVTGTDGKIANPGTGIYLGNNGTAMRFLAGVAALGEGDFLLTGDRRLCERPMKPLLDALRLLGAESTCQGKEGCPLSSFTREGSGRGG